MFNAWNPADVSVVVAGNIIGGWGDDTFVTVERSEDAFSLKVGIDGIGARAKNNNRSGTVSLTLMNTSKSNDVLSALAAADELSGQAAFPIMVRDANGTMLATALTAWITKIPTVEFGKEVGNRTWQFTTDSLIIFAGGM